MFKDQQTGLRTEMPDTWQAKELEYKDSFESVFSEDFWVKEGPMEWASSYMKV
jgi:hypothetical protein